ncbi:MAG: hypothetical protein Q4D88_01275 [Anaerococcus sp.]|nr:hypothetical protein [Anaerococcus sp.]
MKDISSWLVYEENSRKINKEKIISLKKMRVDILSIELDLRLKKSYLRSLFDLNKRLEEQGIILMLRFDIMKLTRSLLDSKDDSMAWDNPKLRKAFYSFINFLVKRGIRAFDFLSFTKLLSLSKNPAKILNLSRELNKNARSFNENLITTGYLEPSNLKLSLYTKANPKGSFTYLYTDRSVMDNFDKLIDLSKKGARISIKVDSLSKANKLTLRKEKALLTPAYLTRGPIIKKSDINKDLRSNIKNNEYILDLRAYQKNLIDLKKSFKSLNSGNIYQVFKKEADIISYIRNTKDEKSLIISNLSQKEILLNMAMYVANYDSYSIFLSNYPKRRVVDLLLLRAYEVLVLVKS